MKYDGKEIVSEVPSGAWILVGFLRGDVLLYESQF